MTATTSSQITVATTPVVRPVAAIAAAMMVCGVSAFHQPDVRALLRPDWGQPATESDTRTQTTLATTAISSNETDALATELARVFATLAQSQVELEPDVAAAIVKRRWEIYL